MRSTTVRAVAGTGVLALLAVACAPAPPPGGSNPSAGNACAATASLDPPISATTAAADARDAYREVADAPGEVVTLVQTELTTAGPQALTVTVASAGQAAAAARAAATDGGLVAVEPAAPVTTAALPPNDPYFAQQWGLRFGPGVAPATSFGAAWDTTTGAGVAVAVVDTGVDAAHPDLAGRVLPGRVFLGHDTAGQPGGTADGNGHGTHVAGIIAATRGNGVGISGAAPSTNVLPVKALDDTGAGWMSDVANGVTWAANNGATVINLSIGGTASSAALDNAIAYARQRGAVVVAAAGNLGLGAPPSYPGASPGVVTVAALDGALARAGFSGTGCHVDVAAPGVGIWSTVPGTGYQSWSGTSMASPFVAAAAALLRAHRPSCTVSQIEARLHATADPLGGPRPNDRVGYGVVDPAEALGSC